MELSRIGQLLGKNNSQPNTVKAHQIHHNQENIPGNVLRSPDILFNSTNNSKNTLIQPNSLNLFSDNTGKKLIDVNTRVLHIGDSHTVGVYGHEMDKLMRETGAHVETVGSAGSSPSWYINGHATHSGFYSKDEAGNVDAPADWKAPHDTPKLNTLVHDFKPNVIVISLGANLINGSGNEIEGQVKKLANLAKESGAKIIWVGPPNHRETTEPASKEDFLYQHLQKVAAQYGTFVDSRPYTHYPATGGDGLHYTGVEGTKIAKSWAGNVFNTIQNSK